MSPYERPPPTTPGSCQAAALQVLLSEFDVTSNGFLPAQEPIARLHNPYYAQWESLIRQIPSCLEDQTLRDEINSLPILSLEHLTTQQEQRRAYLILTFFTHAYIWGGAAPAQYLPPSVVTPLLQVSDLLGLPPVATFASLNLWNFHSSNPSADFTDVDSLKALHTFTGTEDESWFYMVSVAIEAQGAYIIPLLLGSLDSLEWLISTTTTATSIATSKGQSSAILAAATAALTSLTTCVVKMGTLLDRMYDKCDPAIFYHRIRPFLAGSKNMSVAGLPKGVFYDEGNGSGSWRQLRGGSNGQSSLIQFLDIALGVEHSSSGNSDPEGDVDGLTEKTMSFHQEVRGYMPERHRGLLEHVMKLGGGGGFRRVIGLLREGYRDQVELADLQGAFRTATKALVEFRNKHLQLVTRYIIVPSRHQRPSEVQVDTDLRAGHGGGVKNLATASSASAASGATASEIAGSGNGEDGKKEGEVKLRVPQSANAELTGTGGTALLPFLKQSRDETYQAGELPEDAK